MSMKKYVQTIVICSFILILFPFIGLPEFWEYLYVIIPAFIIGYSGLRLMKRINIITEGSDADSLHDYINSLKNRFKEETKKHEVSEEE